MSPGMVKMWISIGSMGAMAVAIFLIYLSRFKLKKGVLKFIVTLLAYFFLIISGFIMVLVVLGGPTSE